MYDPARSRRKQLCISYSVARNSVKNYSRSDAVRWPFFSHCPTVRVTAHASASGCPAYSISEEKTCDDWRQYYKAKKTLLQPALPCPWWRGWVHPDNIPGNCCTVIGTQTVTVAEWGQRWFQAGMKYLAILSLSKVLSCWVYGRVGWYRGLHWSSPYRGDQLNKAPWILLQ